jgi:cytoskeletal protein CcmA (bactofilin family)
MTAHARSYLFSITILVTLFVLSTSFASAAVIRIGDIYTHGTDSVQEGDTYLFGDTVSVHGSSTDDLFVFAGTSDVLGPVGGDAFTVGGKVHVTSSVTGDLRAAGGEVYVMGDVEEDALLFGSTVIIGEDARIGGDLLVYAEYVEMLGTVAGNVTIRSQHVAVAGVVEGPARIEISESLELRGGARFDSGLTYRSHNELTIPTDVSVTGDVVHEPWGATEKSDNEAAWPGILFRILMSLLAGVLVLKLFPSFSREASTLVLANNGTIALTGLAVLVSVPVLALLLMATVFGIMPGTFILFAYGTGIVFAFALTPILAGTALAMWLKKEDGQQWHWVSLGATALVLLTLLPVVGWIVRLIVFLTAFGVTARILHERIWKRRKENEGDTQTIEPVSTDAPSTHEEHHEEEKPEQTKEGEESAK